MSDSISDIVIADRKTLQQTISSIVREVMLESVPSAIREANLPEWLSREQAKERYGLTNRQLTYLRNNRRVEYSQHGRRIFYRRESLDKYFEEGRVKARKDEEAS